LFRSNRSAYRHRRETWAPFLAWLFGIQPRRSNYHIFQDYSPGRKSASAPRREVRFSQSGFEVKPESRAEQHARNYRQRTAPQPDPARPSYQRAYNEPRKTVAPASTARAQPQPHGNQKFRPLPPPVGQLPYRLSLEAVLAPAQIQAIQSSQRIILHIAGDTGGVKVPQSQLIVAMAMEDQFGYADASLRPAYFYNLGDVVYYFGEPKEYFAQFYEPYDHYPAPIFAIPGNHDGDVAPNTGPSLTGFVNNFCTAHPHTSPDAGEAIRETMTQPHVYWTLQAPFVTTIGLYSNVPEGGQIDDNQFRWFVNELREAPTDKALIVTVHHPPYSADGHHSGSHYMQQTLDSAFQQSGRIADMVFSGHVHNYQRFTRQLSGREIPYIVAGAGGYWHLHYMAKLPSGEKMPAPYRMPEGPILESYCDDHHGFMRLMVTPTTVTGEYFTVSRPQESWRAAPVRTDLFFLDLRSHRMLKSGTPH
jgi:predicted phosphodiesterase